jgi:hypothetical protein
MFYRERFSRSSVLLMPPVPTIAGVYRIVLLWLPQGGISPRNVFHIHTATTDVDEIADNLSAAFNDHQFDPKASDNNFLQIEITPLDGHTAGTIHTMGHTTQGTGTGGLMPSTAAVLSIRSAQKGAQGRGRQYIGPVTEDKAQAGILDPTSQGLVTDGWVDFAASIDLSMGAQLGVASYTHAAFYPETSLSCDRLVGTQRRRQDQLRV